MEITWGTIKSLLLFLAQSCFPKPSHITDLSAPHPAFTAFPYGLSLQKVSRALLILFATAVAFFVRSLPAFPQKTSSRSHSRDSKSQPTSYLQDSHPSGPMDSHPFDEALRTKINSLEARLLFFQYGPDVMANCQFCNPEDPNSYLYYALPGIFGPHLFNLVILALVTSGLLVGKEGEKWRVTATMAAGAVALGEVYFVCTYGYQGNARATRLEDIDFFYSKMRMFRGTFLATIDTLIGLGLYLSSTNRAFITPPSPAENIEVSLRILDSARSKMSATGIMRNTINRDEELRNRSQGYWQHEVRLTGELMEDREVVDSVNNAMTSNRINIAAIAADAQTYADNVVAPLEQSGPGMNGAI